MFYQSVSKEKLEKEKNKTIKKNLVNLNSDNNYKRQRNVWLWAGTIIVMLAILFFWAHSLSSQLQITSLTKSISADIFQNTQTGLDNLLQNSTNDLTDIKKAAGSILTEMRAATSSIYYSTSTTLPALTPEQIQELKNKIEK